MNTKQIADIARIHKLIERISIAESDSNFCIIGNRTNVFFSAGCASEEIGRAEEKYHPQIRKILESYKDDLIAIANKICGKGKGANDV